MKIVVPGKPVAWKRVGISRGRFYNRQQDIYDQLYWFFKRSMPKNLLGQEKKPFNEPLRVTLTFYMQKPESWGTLKKKKVEGKPHMTKPDIDNLAKLILDAGQESLWKTDAVIAQLVCKKLYSDTPRTEIEIESLDDGNIL